MDIDKRNRKIYNKIITTDKDKNFDKYNLIGKTIRNIKINKYLGLTNSHNRVYECNCINCNQKLILTTSMINDTRSNICNCQRKYNFKIEDPCIKPLYRRWNHMRQRCNNASDQKFSNYGGRNIKVCPEWDNIQTGFLNFYNWAINNGWSPYKSLSIDRIDVNKGYSPDNCRWADNKMQATNRTDNHYIQYNQWIFPVNIWAEIIGLNYNTLFCRIYKYGWSIEKSLFTNTKINSDNIKIPYEYEIYNKYQEWIDNKKIQPFELEMNSGHPVIHDFKPENGGNNMKFLPANLVTPSIIPLNFIYDKGKDFGDDTLTIIFKDNISNQKSSYTIKQPVIEAYFVKPEYRTFDNDLSHHWFPIDKCYKKVVPYATRYYEAAKELGLENSEQAKLNPYVYGIDIEIENFYLIQFVKEYPCHEPKNINCGYFDIENDIIRIEHFPEYGETPINAVTYIDGSNKTAYTLVLAKMDIPTVSQTHPKYAEYEDLKERWRNDLETIRSHIPEFIQYLHQKYDENYPGFEFYLAFFDEEIQLIQAFWEIAKECNNDFVYAWNIPYDMQNMMTRPGILGYNVNEIIPDEKACKDVPNASVSFVEDKNSKVGKRKHQCVTWTLPTFLDQMVIYAGIRGGRGELASTKLNYIAQLELKDEKLDYSEDADIKTLFYRNLYKFIEYNLKDVLLQYGIETKTMDIQTIYSRMYDLFVTPSQSFTTTKVVLHALYSYALGKGFILGQNRNKNHKNLILPKYGEIFANVTVDTTEEEYFDEVFGDPDEEENPEEEGEEGTVKREKYAGAFVMNPLYIAPTGVYIRGKPSKFVHNHVVDLDVTSEYPSAVIIGNISSETLVGRVFLEGELPNIPIPDVYEFRGDEAVKYKMDASNFMLEQYSERDYLSFAHTFLNLPTFSEICDMIDNKII